MLRDRRDAYIVSERYPLCRWVMMTCIYCSADGPATHTPHILPESILRNDVTLPVGAECDRCGNSAQKYEAAVLHHNRIWPVVVLYRLPGKGGRIRRRLTRSLARVDDGSIVVTAATENVRLEPYRVSVVVPDDPPQYSDYRFRRGLHHIAFNYLAWKLGPAAVLAAQFDRVRNYVRRGLRSDKWPYVQMQYPHDQPPRQLRLTLVNDDGHVVRFQSFYDDFYVSLTSPDVLHAWAARELPDAGRL